MVTAESNYIRERTREVGLGELADRVGVSLSYLSQASRDKRNLGRRSRREWRGSCRPR